MRILNLEGRLHIELDGNAVDVEKASSGRFSSDPQAVFHRWPELLAWHADYSALDASPSGIPYELSALGPVVPRPAQIFAVGLNYVDHAAESGFTAPDEPMVFPKWPSSIVGPFTEITLPGGNVDWEVEMVAVIGLGGRDIPEESAWEHVAGVTIGQDLSERSRQLRGQSPQFGLAKSHQAFGPIGPVLVSTDEFENPDDLGISCSINGRTVQSARTGEMIFSVPALISYLSETVELYPGDLIFTGTPPGVGLGMNPQTFIRPGDLLESAIEGIGKMEQIFVAGT